MSAPGSRAIKLGWGEMVEAAVCGIGRQIVNLKEGRKPAYGADDKNDWQKHVEGAMGERAFAKSFQLYHSGAYKFRALDVGDCEVKTTEYASGFLPLHRSSRDDAPFVLVTGVNGDYIIRGWIYGRDGKLDEYWRDPTGKNRESRRCFCVPQSALRSLDELSFKL